MKDSNFKKGAVKTRSSTHFTKSETPVSSFSIDFDGKELVSHAMEELSDFLSALRRSGFSQSTLEINPTPHGEQLSISIMRRNGTPFNISEMNLICRLAVENGLSPRVTDGGVEVLYMLPKLVDANLYARVLALLREDLNG